MDDHPLLRIIGIMSGVFGAIFIVAFLFAFSPQVMSAEKADELEATRRPGRLATILAALGVINANLDAKDYKKTWKATRGDRFLVPLGLLLCGGSYIIYHFL